MLTPQEVSTHAFTKAMMGGYNMAMVDEFLDELTDDYTTLYKENAALKAKMKVLVEKVEDYRATEDSMRATLLTAQKMADSIVHDAEAKRDEILAQAQSEASRSAAQTRRLEAEGQERMRQGQLQLAQFIATTRRVCQQQLELLEQLPELSVTVHPDETPVAEEIEERVLSGFSAEQPTEPPAEEKQPEAVPAAAPAAAPTVPAEEPVPVAPTPAAEPIPETTQVSEPTRRINLSDLKFGRNYPGSEL